MPGQKKTEATDLLKLLLRYGLVGSALAFTYILLTTVIIELLGWPALPSSVTAFALNLPAAYVGHRHGTFQTDGPHFLQMRRFALVMTVAFTVSTASIVVLVNVLNQHYSFALLTTTVFVPMVNFCVLRRWVFAADE